MYASAGSYTVDSIFQGWSRIDMLLALYDKAITHLGAAKVAGEKNQILVRGERILDAQKCILGIYSGLKPEDDQSAFNVARLLHFSLGKIAENELEVAAKILESIRNGFEAIREEATRLEAQGEIPSLQASQSLDQQV